MQNVEMVKYGLGHEAGSGLAGMPSSHHAALIYTKNYINEFLNNYFAPNKWRTSGTFDMSKCVLKLREMKSKFYAA